MRRKLIIDGNAVYEIDDECACHKRESVLGQVSQQDSKQEPKTIEKRGLGQKRQERELWNIHDLQLSMNKNS